MMLEDRAEQVAAEVIQRTSGMPHRYELANALRRFAREFAADVGAKLVTSDADDARLAIRNAIDRTAKGEP